MSAFERAIKEVFHVEGGFSNDPNDRGGPTKYGVTEAVARAHGYSGRMEELSLYTAQQIAKQQYWDILRLDEIAMLSYPIAKELLDTGYNMGPGIAGRFLQQSLNAFNRQGKDYHDVKVDGVLGPLTVHALRLFMVKRGIAGQAVLLKALNALQGARYIEIARNDETQEKYVYGWFSNRVDLSANS